ncbi:MAG: histidinol dehydrogenase [Helicobacteraceae bacterium]|jgi:histidinol dehydrogenase|nr:histidinol dehydrogenase [Helicobacteraceae bacterium]
MRILDTSSEDFNERFNALLNRANMDMKNAAQATQAIIDEIKSGGDLALLDHIARFDRWKPKSIEEIVVSSGAFDEAWEQTPPNLQSALKSAFDRVRRFHEKQAQESWIDFSPEGWLGQKITPVDRAGLYIPGGKAAYPSSLLMNAIPAIVAGVGEIVVCSPAPDNAINPLTLAAAHLCGIKRLFKIGGASAIAAMAYGTQSIPKVDVITGPGNIFVAAAKKAVFGDVNIDMIAGPSEIGVIADSGADAEIISIDLLSQAEHDEMASCVLITPDRDLAERTKAAAIAQLNGLKRAAIAKESIEKRGAIIVTKSLDEAIDLMNQIAPEHLEILTANPRELLDRIKHAGAIFLGKYTPEAIGDYVAGPNHTLPTGGAARFFSPLGVENFLKKSSIIALNKEGFSDLAAACADLANAEGLTAHALSVQKRVEKLKNA